MTISEIVAKIDTGAGEKRAAEELNKRDAYDVLMVGSAQQVRRRPFIPHVKALVPV